jgi:hypothetical protein
LTPSAPRLASTTPTSSSEGCSSTTPQPRRVPTRPS